MPFPNFHAARIREPGRFLRIRQLWENKGIRALGGPLKTDPRGPTKIQTLRFEKQRWTVAEARAWLKKHGYKSLEFEPAKEAAAQFTAQLGTLENLTLQNRGEYILISKDPIDLEQQTLYAMAAPSGAGKSSAAVELAKETKATITSNSKFLQKEGAGGQYRSVDFRMAERKCRADARKLLADGHGVIIDNTNVNNWNRDVWAEMASRFDVPLVFVLPTFGLKDSKNPEAGWDVARCQQNSKHDIPGTIEQMAETFSWEFDPNALLIARGTQPMGELLFASEQIEIFAVEGEEKPIRFRMVAYTGGTMDVGFGYPVVVDLDGLKTSSKPRPVLKDHDPKDPVGHTDKIEIKDRKLYVEGLVSGTGEAAAQVVASAKNGFPWQASIHATIQKQEFVKKGAKVEANEKSFVGPLYVARRSTLKEISFVALGADDDTVTRIAAEEHANPDKEGHKMDYTAWLKAKGFEADSLSEEQSTNLKALYDAEIAAAEKDSVGTIEVVAEDATENVLAEYRKAQAEETKRVNKVREICAGKHGDLEAKAIEDGWVAERIELEILRADRPSVSNVDVGEPNLNGKTLTAAAMLAVNISSEKVKADPNVGEKAVIAAQDLRGIGFKDICRHTLAMAGQSVQIGFDDRVIEAALRLPARDEIQAANFSTTSLAGITGAVANKLLLEGYEAPDSVARKVMLETDVSNLQQQTHYRMTDEGEFDEVNTAGELHSGTLDEESYTSQAKTYGKIVGLTRTQIINDDLNAFAAIPRRLGRAAANKLEYIGFQILMDAGGTFYVATHRNLATSNALSVSGMNALIKLFREQVDAGAGAAGGTVAKKGKPINIMPKILLVPPALEFTADQLYTSATLNETTTANAPKPVDNPHRNKYAPLTSPYLSNQNLTNYSDTTWYMFADPADSAAFVITYLQGKRAPTIETAATNFRTLGTDYRAFFDFGVDVLDWRAGYKSTA